jgi:hypothetical protein
MPLRFASTSPGFHPVQVQWCTNHQSQTLRTPLLQCSFVTLSDRPASESSVAARAFWNRPERTTRDNPTSPQPESLPLWDQLREAFGDTGDDPGHWNYSPEWQVLLSFSSQCTALDRIVSHNINFRGALTCISINDLIVTGTARKVAVGVGTLAT